ncbi:MAG: DsbA family protein [Butyrivibrio sp.]|uniref:DsbA family protein n=1 Tax=Butyrivibrio sp. TaxID=28121 RepID=UPI001B1D6B35|nr:DsbA family protein [Butyrivibrio sp.]MBO6240594.1 DsbA family protein [Butyrivibrio sp.]
MDKIIITTFTDPMMGLTYECEPIYDKLQEYYGDALELKYVMAGLVRDVSDFMIPDELALPAKEGIKKYNKRLAGIYKSEESIGGLPINMKGFHLFDEEHRSSYPLNIAYKAAQLADNEKADLFLYNLRHATVLEARQTTLTTEILNVAKDTGINTPLQSPHILSCYSQRCHYLGSWH